MKPKITIEYLNSLGYADFVGLINQWNVLPGSYVTLSKWINYGHIDEKSNILQVACTTGFQSREIALLTNCQGTAFDISKFAIKSAIYNKEEYAPNVKIEYLQCDGYKFNTKQKYSQKMKNKCVSLLKDGGYLLASPFYVIQRIPGELCKQAKSIFGIDITNNTYNEVMELYNDLEIIYECKNSIEIETPQEIEKYCKYTVERAKEILNIKDNDVINYIYNRLKTIRQMSNKLRPYQGYTVLVLRYRKNLYPKRYVELF